MNTALIKSKFTSTKTFWLIIGMVFLSLFLRELPFVGFLWAPFTQFETLLHEMSHALACVFTGGWVTGLTIVEDGNGHGGLTFTHGGIPFIYSQAGYIGEALWGCLLIALSRFPRISRGILIGIGVCVGIVSIWFMPGGIFAPVPGMWVEAIGSLVWGLAMAAGLVYIGRKLSDKWAHLALTFLAVNSCLSALQGVWVLLLQSLGAFPGTWSDATNMAELTGIPAVAWGLLWSMISVGMLSWTMYMTYKADQSTPATQSTKASTAALGQAPSPKAIETSAAIEAELIQLQREVDKGEAIKITPKQKQQRK